VSLERPTGGVTRQSVHALLGRITGGEPKLVQLQLNGVPQILDVWGTEFQGEIALHPGRNEIQVVAMRGRDRVEHRVDVEYRPPEPSPEIRILSPPAGPLPHPVPDVLEIEGEADGPGGQVRVVFNGFAVPAFIQHGRFSARVPRLASEMTIWAEASGGMLRRSRPVTVSVPASAPPAAFLLLHLPSYGRVLDAKVSLVHRPDATTAETLPAATPLAPSAVADGSCAVFSLPAKPGAYSLILDYRLPIGDLVKDGWGMIFVPGAQGYRVWRLGPFRLTGRGRTLLGRFLLPQGIFWDEEGWYNGTSASADVVTRFRYEDGVLWAERRDGPFPTQ
jgi:hypothetical protein